MESTQLVKNIQTGDLASYSELKQRIREAIAAGKERAEAAVEREKVRTYWEIGKLVNGHILLNKTRADYGKKVLKRLAADLGVAHSELYYILEFARVYPIFPTSGKLTWSHIREFLGINNSDIREEMTERALHENWSVRTLRDEIKKLKAANASAVTEPEPEELLVPIKGDLDTYRIINGKAGPWQGEPVVDLGFSNRHTFDTAVSFKEKNIVRVSEKGKLSLAKDATEADLFTYRAYLLQITDGDTIWFTVDLGFGHITEQHLRLRGINTPEMDTAAGEAAKRFVARELAKSISPFVTITSTKSDKYDRYLADVFYATKKGEQFLNNRLLEEGHAARAD